MLKRFLVSAVALAAPTVASVAIAARPGTSAASEPHFVAISDVVVPIIDAGRINGQLRFDVVLDAIDEAGAARLAIAEPRLRSATVTTGIEFSRLYVSGLTPVDADKLASELTHVLQRENPDVGRVLIVKIAAAMV